MRTALIAGVDEVGRGSLAGPVFAAAVILHPAHPIAGLADSKQLSAIQREKVFARIHACALAWAIGAASVTEIDRYNILQASLLAMRRAIYQLSLIPTQILIDGRYAPAHLPCTATTIIKGDCLEPAISAASIVAKVLRDQLMRHFGQQHPHYGFGQHKGYPTKQHLAALWQHGACCLHRCSFAPVAATLSSQSMSVSNHQ